VGRLHFGDESINSESYIGGEINANLLGFMIAYKHLKILRNEYISHFQAKNSVYLGLLSDFQSCNSHLIFHLPFSQSLSFGLLCGITDSSDNAWPCTEA
jgi:hypothetical protein